jgi:hypothetical protein
VQANSLSRVPCAKAATFALENGARDIDSAAHAPRRARSLCIVMQVSRLAGCCTSLHPQSDTFYSDSSSTSVTRKKVG